MLASHLLKRTAVQNIGKACLSTSAKRGAGILSASQEKVQLQLKL